MTIDEFYWSLPKIKDVPNFYIPAYTEALKTYVGVRVIPNESFCEGLSPVYMRYLKHFTYPTYFIPIHNGHNCYGFVLKSYEKKTPRLHTNSYLPGYDSVKDGKPVVFVEGFKDTYLLRKAGICCIPMLTATLQVELLTILAQRHCPVVFCPDNDSEPGKRDNTIVQFRKKVKDIKDFVYVVYKLEHVKDLGDFFDGVHREIALEQAKKIVKICKKLEVYCGSK